MQPLTQYFIDSLGGQPWYRCCQCQYDSFQRENIQQHVKSHPARFQPPADWNNIQGYTIGLSLLTWNTVEASLHSLAAIARESRILQGLGLKPAVFWCDNGSTDGTVAKLTELAEAEGLAFAAVSLHTENEGQSAGRNELLKNARTLNCQYLLMVDGDVEIVPNSAFTMANYMETHDQGLACLGVYCRNCTNNAQDPDLTPVWNGISQDMLDAQPAIAWTNYGMFAWFAYTQFDFDTNGPFAGPGWGFEDDDYYLQMAERGYRVANTKYIRHLHRSRHSSLGLMDRSLAAKVFADRKAYLLTKWQDSTNPEVRRIVNLIANQTFPVLP